MNGNGMNFFGWIRDGVRQSVLLGVSDAVEQLGTPTPAEELHPSVAGFLKVGDNRGAGSSTKLLSDSSSNQGSGPKSRRRLGKSLKDIGSTAEQPKS